MAEIGVIGAGSWGIALSWLLTNNGHKVTVWSVIESEIEMLKTSHEHKDKLPGVKLQDSMQFTTDLESTCKDKDLLALIKYIAEEDRAEKVLENQAVLKLPIVRNGQKATVGYQPDVWKGWKD